MYKKRYEKRYSKYWLYSKIIEKKYFFYTIDNLSIYKYFSNIFYSIRE